MKTLLDIFGPRALVIAMAMLLALGGRAQAVISTCLAAAPQTVAQQGPVEEDEEHRQHEGKAQSERRTRQRLPAPPLVGVLADLRPAHFLTRGATPRHAPLESGADLRNGLGAPLRC